MDKEDFYLLTSFYNFKNGLKVILLLSNFSYLLQYTINFIILCHPVYLKYQAHHSLLDNFQFDYNYFP